MVSHSGLFFSTLQDLISLFPLFKFQQKSNIFSCNIELWPVTHEVNIDRVKVKGNARQLGRTCRLTDIVWRHANSRPTAVAGPQSDRPQVCVDPRTSDLNMTLPARPLAPGLQQTSCTSLLIAGYRSTGQTDGRTPYRYIDAHCWKRAATSINDAVTKYCVHLSTEIKYKRQSYNDRLLCSTSYQT